MAATTIRIVARIPGASPRTTAPWGHPEEPRKGPWAERKRRILKEGPGKPCRETETKIVRGI
eukprot:4881838-Alexandrium_andersonii.AAC.1